MKYKLIKNLMIVVCLSCGLNLYGQGIISRPTRTQTHKSKPPKTTPTSNQRNLTPSEMVYKGRIAEQNSDYKEALRWYRKAADQGDVEAQYNLGCMYDNGNGVPKDLSEAHIWYEKAAALGDVYAKGKLMKC